MKTKQWIALPVLLTVFLMIAHPAISAPTPPLDSVKIPVEKAIAILKDPDFTAPEKKEAQREKIWEIVRQVFDFEAVSMRTLAKSWDDFNETQRKAFIEVFSTLMKNTYVDKIQGEFHDEVVQFVGQDIVADDKAEVKSKVIRGGKIEIPIDYSVYLASGQWKVYDVKIEGVSLVKNYRNQFKTILAKETPDQLIQRIKDLNEKHQHDRKIKK